MASNFAYKNTRDFEFILKEWLPTEQIFSYPRFSAYYSLEDISSILETTYKISKELIEPSNAESDAIGCVFADGAVKTPPSMGPLFKKIQADGWGSSNIDESEDAVVLPHLLHAMILEMFTAANPSFIPYVNLTSGAAGLIQSFATEALKEMFLPKMMDGTWSGTMCITEATAGSDVGDMLSRAYPTETPQVFKIKGSKVFITGGDNDFTENIIHLFLARSEGALPGTRGLSLFIVPKYWVNPDGSLEENDVTTVGIEHKLGQYGSVTASLAFGENDNCRGWLLGRNPLENNGQGDGIAQMFQMMNGARMETGHLALSCTANAFYNARDYCSERIQGRPMNDPAGNRVPIIQHEDIRRTLLMGKAHVEAMRAMIYKTHFAFDVRKHDPDSEQRKKANIFVELMTPVCKAYLSDEAWWLIGEAIQSYGGYGYCEEYPVAQIARDVKIYSIWEGTNYIQAMDLVGRKWSMGKGAYFQELLDDIAAFCETHKNNEDFHNEFTSLRKAVGAYIELKSLMTTYSKQGFAGMLPLYARRILTATGQLLAGWCILDQAILALKKAREIGTDHYDYAFYTGKVSAARYYLMNVVPNVLNVVEVIRGGDQSALEVSLDSFNY